KPEKAERPERKPRDSTPARSPRDAAPARPPRARHPVVAESASDIAPPAPVTPTPAAPTRRRRDDDLGPSVAGFGDDVPAFMLVRVRPTRPTPRMAPDEGEA
ncbi:MAG: hypothetical protein ABI224_13450, partial [Acetobacteraceae bacterium]